MCVFRMRCFICNREFGHSPHCILTQLTDPLEIWTSTAPSNDTLMPWALSPPQWLLGEALDPNMVLPIPAAAAVPEHLDDVYDILRNMAGGLSGEIDEPEVSPDASQALRNWLENDPGAGPPAAAASGASSNLPLPPAWRDLQAGLELVGDATESADELGIEWNLLHCNEGSESLDRPGRPWPSAHEVADSLLANATASGETRPIATVLPMTDRSEPHDDVIRFMSNPASPDEADETEVIPQGSPDGTFRPLRSEPVTIPLEPVAQGACGGLGFEHRSTDTSEESDEAAIDTREGLPEAPEEGTEMRPSPIQAHWTRIQARRSGVVERTRGRVAHIRPMPRAGGRATAYLHRPDPRRFRFETTAPVVRSQEILSRVTSPLGSIAEETLAEIIHMARHQATQVPRIRQRDAALQVLITTPQRTMATQTMLTMMGAMTLGGPLLTSSVTDEVTLRVTPEASASGGTIPYSDVSSDCAIEAESTPEDTSESAGTPVQDEREG
jgi:hypothetical protein